MPRMIDLIRQSAVPANIMRSAARGTLSLPDEEMLEILVHLSEHPMFGEQARLTLAGWDQTSAARTAGNPDTPVEVLTYLSSPQNLRSALLEPLLSNPAVSDRRIEDLAMACPRDQIAAILAHPRVRTSRPALRALRQNRNLDEVQIKEIDELLPSAPDASPKTDDDDNVLDIEISAYLKDHADEIKAAEGSQFHLFGWTAEEQAELMPTLPNQPGKQQGSSNERLSPLQKIARMSVGERVQLAMKGNKDERFILIRDGSRVVCSAVLESPKMTDSEVENFAAMKNVHEAVLRGIAAKRKFIKNYAVIRILTMNPRCPLDVSLPLLPHLITMDLKHLSINKNVSDTLRKLALKMFRDRLKDH